MSRKFIVRAFQSLIVIFTAVAVLIILFSSCETPAPPPAMASFTQEDVNTAQQAGFDAGYAIGYIEGKEIGHTEGYTKGYGNCQGRVDEVKALSYEKGYHTGQQDGYARGYDDGVKEGG